MDEFMEEKYNIPWDSPLTLILLIGCLVVGVVALIFSVILWELALVIVAVAGVVVGGVNLLRLRARHRRAGPR